MEKQEGNPYVICHMLQSIDGRIAGQMFQSSATLALSQVYQDIGKEYNADAIIYGKTTAEEIFTHNRKLDLSCFSNQQVEKVDFINMNENMEWVVVIDAQGTLAWSKTTLKHKRLQNKNVIMVLSEKVCQEYLLHLRTLGISYIFAGKSTLSMRKAVEKLGKQFHIKKVLLQGGGIINESFACENLIDELSLVISPVIGGERNVSTSFDSSHFVKLKLIQFQLVKTEIINHSGLWLNYIKEG